jgi:hypothetical protein
MARGVRKKSSAGGRRLHFNGKRRGGGPGGVDAAWRKQARAKGAPKLVSARDVRRARAVGRTEG